MSELQGKRIHINGIVQGVGFRPFVYGLATRLQLTGWVRNTSAGVDIEVDGPPERLRAFATALLAEAPPLAQIDEIEVLDRPANGFPGFEIVHSEAVVDAFQPISPDVGVCGDCLRELFDPRDRRYRYPFINCTNCGPRFTIIKDVPYDRPETTMAPFEMCPECRAEYEDPLDRRFHAQPVACSACGPQVWLEVPGGDVGARADEAIAQARELLLTGHILAVKGLGGFHLACDATNATAVTTLRHRKLRVDKPFALMLPDVETVERHCFVSAAERTLLEARARPIVVLRRRPDSPIATAVAPGQNTVGVMLPYTPLHYLLLEPGAGIPEGLVMTSGNLSEEPIATGNAEARARLARLADAFLLHDRDIHIRCDDSVMRAADVELSTANATPLYPLRRSRGYAPFPVRLPRAVPPLLAAGAELKNTFCLTNGRYAFLSHHIGDLENYETLQSFEQGVAHFERLFRVRPQAIAYDLHPNYMATRYALARAEREGLPAVGVQHHHAHIAACMAEHGLPGDAPVIGVSFDGTGHGPDGAVWGGEFLVADYGGYERPYHLAYVPLPGGDKAVKAPWRMALAWLHRAGAADLDAHLAAWAARDPDAFPLPPAELLPIMLSQIESGLNTPATSSMGRLFDAVAALAGVRVAVNYEAQAAIELEALVDADERSAYEFAWSGGEVDAAPIVAQIVADVAQGTAVATIAARFHNGVAHMVHDICRELRSTTGISRVALSGGVWQNVTLLTRTVPLLTDDDFTVYLHHKVPANDGGLALGQAVIAAHALQAP